MMRTRCAKALLMAGGALMGLVGVGHAAAAQTPASTVDEVIVTATRRHTTLDSTPVAISALKGETLAARGLTNLFEAGPSLPGVSINGTAGYGNFPLGIRGIAASTSLVGADDPVAVYIDGAYVGKPSAVLADLLDIDSVEIVRGPQGTLYGRNATAGAILISHRDPSAEPSAAANASYGSFGRWRLDGRASGPLADGLAGSLAVSTTDMDGWGRNTFNGSKAVRRKASSAVGAVAFEAGDLRSVLRADYVDETVHDGLKRLNAMPYNTANPIVADASLRGDPDIYAFNTPTQYRRRDGGVSLNQQLTLDRGIALHATASYRHDELAGGIDTDGTAANVNTNRTDESLDQVTLSLYATGGTTNSWIVGVDLYKGISEVSQVVGAVAINSSLSIFANNDAFSGALFGEYTAALGNDLSLTGGARLSAENKEFEYRGEGRGVIPSTPNTVLEKSWTSFTPSARLSYRPSDDFLAYASVATGFKSGGFTALQARPFDPERVVTYEAGMKAAWLERRLRLNGSVFYSDYKDLQVRIPVSLGVINTLNAAAATIKGVELEGVWRIAPQFTLSGFANYTHARYDDYIGPGGIQNKGQTLNRAPKWQSGGTATFEQPISAGRLTAEFTYAQRSRIYFSAPNLDGLSSESYQQVDARLAFASLDDRWTLAVMGKNLGADRRVNNVVVFGTNLLASFNEPASYEVRLSVKY